MRWALKLSATGKIRQADSLLQVLSPGDVIYVEEAESGFLLRQIPEVQGAIVAMGPHTGRVLASVGGFSFAQSRFNRATQASRQPGSAFKPFVYAAALDTGYTPATLVADAPIAKPDGTGRIWRPKNYDGKFGGPSTVRTGLEKSRNLMTVRLAQHLGMAAVLASPSARATETTIQSAFRPDASRLAVLTTFSDKRSGPMQTSSLSPAAHEPSIAFCLR